MILNLCLKDQTLRGNLISADIEHFSRYFLLDATKQDKAFKETTEEAVKELGIDDVINGNPNHVVLILDNRFEMDKEKKLELKKNNVSIELAKKVVNRLDFSNTKVSIIHFTTKVELIGKILTSKKEALDILESYKNKPYSYSSNFFMDGAINSAVNMLKKTPINENKHIVYIGNNDINFEDHTNANIAMNLLLKNIDKIDVKIHAFETSSKVFSSRLKCIFRF